MFTKKQQNPVEKSVQKVLDEKNDCFNRLKHMKIILDNYDLIESKNFFQAHFHHIYYIFFNAFTTQEVLSKQKGQKQIREEHTLLYDPILFLFEKILTLLPEQIERKWQFHSIIFVMRKLLNPGNSFKIRQEGIRLFLIWYQIIGETNDTTLDNLFASLVPGLVPNVHNIYPGLGKHPGESDALENSTFHVDHHHYNQGTNETSNSTGGDLMSNYRANFNSCDNEPLIPAPQSEPKETKNYYFLQYIMDYLVSQVSRIHWREPREYRQRKCFAFLFEKFKTIYLPHLFPNLDTRFSIYASTLEVPTNRKSDDEAVKDRLLPFKCVIILWLAKYMRDEEKEVTRRRNSYDNLQIGHHHHQKNLSTVSGTGAGVGGGGTTSSIHSTHSESSSEWREPSAFDYDLVRSTFCSTRSNINLLHQIFRQAFLMPFQQANTMNTVVSVYRNWILSANDVPIFMKEPSSADASSTGDDSIRAGHSALYRVFIANAANIFLLQVPFDEPKLLDEQVEMCKRVLNTWRYMLMELEMNKCTWELLLSVLLRITSFLYTEKVPPRKEETLGGRLAPAFFQTLVVGMIKANLEAYISANLWEQFQATLTSLTQWEELIKDWSKNMESLTRNVSYHVYHINLHDLPLDRQIDKRKRTAKATKSFLPSRSSKEVKKTPPTRSNGTVSFSMSSNRSINNNSSISTSSNSTSTVTNAMNSSSVAKKQSNETVLDASNHQTKSRPQLSSFDCTTPHNLLIKYANSSRSLVRSPSDSQLLTRSRISARKRAHTVAQSATPLSSKSSANASRSASIFRSKSLDHFSFNLFESPSSSQSSVYHMRSPSPTPSSGIDTTSLKDSPWNLEGNNSLSSNNSSSSVSTAVRSVAAGGPHRGWSAESSFIIWRRMLGALGDVNQIKDPQLHFQVMECLSNILDIFITIRDNLGVSVDNMSTPPSPNLVPPIHFFAPWLFETLQLSHHYKKGKIIAYKLLCLIAIRTPELQLTNEFLSLFYSSIHRGLHYKDLETICTIIRYSGVKLFSSSLKGSSVLLLDFVHACDIIVNAKESKDFHIPRFEALSMLGTLMSLTEVCRTLKVLDPNSLEPTLIDCGNTKEIILKILMGARKQEQTDLARCVVLNCLGVIMFQDLKNRTPNMANTFSEIINTFIAETRFNNRYLSRTACDMLKLQCDHVPFLIEAYPSIPKQIVEGLIFSITNHLTMVKESNSYKDYRNLLLSLLLCLGRWCLCLPRKVLFSPIKSDQSPILLLLVIQVLNHVISELEPDISAVKKINESFDNSSKVNDEFGVRSSGSIGESGQLSRSSKNASFTDKNSSDALVIQLAAKMLLGHILYFLEHFPLPVIGATRLSSCINEADDNCFITKIDEHEELTSELFNAPNVLTCMVNNSSIVSFIDLSCDRGDINRSSPVTFVKNDPYVRIIVRDLIGKFSWDCCPIYSNYRRNPSSLDSYSLHTDDFSLKNSSLGEMEEKEEDDDPCLRNDPLDLVLKDIGKCIFTSKKYFPNTPVPALNDNLDQAEENMMALLGNQHYQEMNFIERPFSRDNTSQPPSSSASVLTARKESNATASLDSLRCRTSNETTHQMYFMHCRQLIDQLGFLFWEKRPHVELLNKNDKILRELKNLDNQKCRETHKIAVIYVADGQEDKQSILLNKSGSSGFEKFVSGLGWEVDLETHTGFRGGLQANKSTGVSAPYYANPFCETIFHVSTRIPAKVDEPDSLRRKLTHLGNDEVHIVWSEHSRDYRRGIIPTEFCDCLIVIYPLSSFPGYFRIDVSRKPEVPFFGPLYSGAIVHSSVLSDLVRSTAINASRAQRLQVPFYQHYFEERARSIETIYNSHRDLKSFEDYSSAIFSPSSLPSQFSVPGKTPNIVSASSSTSTVSSSNPITTNINQNNLIPSSLSGPTAESTSSPRSKYRHLPMSNIEHKITSRIVSQQ